MASVVAMCTARSVQHAVVSALGGVRVQSLSTRLTQVSVTSPCCACVSVCVCVHACVCVYVDCYCLVTGRYRRDNQVRLHCR